jgi:A/G-specific adenine glycosylase
MTLWQWSFSSKRSAGSGCCKIMLLSNSRLAIRRQLLAWYRQNARPLPWRKSRNPYRIWISEVMLQQTQVTTVIPYFYRFLETFPTLNKLALADEQAVLRLWEGLGYYRRAHDLCRAAKLLRENKHQTVPNDPQFVNSLPGFGRYTTNAVLSQAYDRRVPILEANSLRVLCRLFGIADNPQASGVRNLLWQHAQQLLPRKSVGEFNQALMELGALVCTLVKPSCAGCPLKRHCQAKLHNRQDKIPLRVKPAVASAIDEVAIIVRKRDRLLLVQRPGEGRWAKMWEFPHHRREAKESADTAARRLLTALGIDADLLGEFDTIRHTVTRFHITMVCVHVQYRHGTLRAGLYPNAAWIRPADLHDYPLSTPQRRLARRLLEVNRANGPRE